MGIVDAKILEAAEKITAQVQREILKGYPVSQPKFEDGDKVQLRWSADMLTCYSKEHASHNGEVQVLKPLSAPQCIDCPCSRRIKLFRVADSHCWPESHMELVKKGGTDSVLDDVPA